MTTPSKDWKEQIADGEDAQFEALAQVLLGLQRSHAHGKKAARGLHAKSHGALRGTFEVLANLPDEARQGLFREPETRPVVIRFSNGSGTRAHDDVQDVRGVALKVIGVEGEKVIPPLADAVTQDFLLIHSDAVAFPTPADFVGVVQAVAGNPLLTLPRLIGTLGFRIFRVLGQVRASMGKPPGSVLDLRLHSALPIRFGDFAAKLDFVPDHEPREGKEDGADRLAKDITARAAAGTLAWTLRAQLFVDEARTPIEDPTVSWSEEVSPFIPVARITVKSQDLASDEALRFAARVEDLAFDPWHALLEHRPLGAMMRARNAAYRVSGQERHAAGEPTSLAELTAE